MVIGLGYTYMASFQICGNCRKPNANSHCGKCQAIYYCGRECQVSHWKVHKRLCGQQAPTPVRGQFTMTKSIRGTQISFGYESRNISLKEKEEFEAAVAAVEQAGIEPPPLDDGGLTSIKLAITSINVPFLAALWMQETQYGEDAPIEIRRVQELATQITGAPNMFHLIIQRAGDKLSPSLSCKSADIRDHEVAITYLNTAYFKSVPARWATVGCTHFLHLLEHCCDVDTDLLTKTLKVQERLALESTWDTKDADIAELQARLDQSHIKVAGQDLFELLSELTRRSAFDNRQNIPLYDIQCIINNTISSVADTNLETILTQRDYRTITTQSDARTLHTVVIAALSTAANNLIASIHFPLLASTTTGDDTSLPSRQVPPYFVVAKTDTRIPFSTLVTWIARQSSAATTITDSIVVTETTAAESADSLVISEARDSDGTRVIHGALPSLNVEERKQLQATAYLNAHLLMIRAMEVDPVTPSIEEFNERVASSVYESAALFILAKHLAAQSI